MKKNKIKGSQVLLKLVFWCYQDLYNGNPVCRLCIDIIENWPDIMLFFQTLFELTQIGY